MKHTPGPWKHFDNYVITHDGEEQICVCGEDWTANNVQANTKLIAAAPDLLEACQNIYDNMCDRDELNDEEGNEYNEVRIIREAIQKANK